MKRRTLDDLLQRMAPVARPVLLEHWVPNCCIAGCAVLARVFRFYGYTSEPVPVKVEAYNAKMLEIIRKGSPIPERGDPNRRLWFDLTGAYGIGIMPESADIMHNVPGGGYGGHLVLRVKNVMVDATIAQASRPGAGIVFPEFGTWPATVEFLQGERLCLQLEQGGAAVMTRIDDYSFRRAPDWTAKEKHLAPMNEIIRGIEQGSTHGAAG